MPSRETASRTTLNFSWGTPGITSKLLRCSAHPREGSDHYRVEILLDIRWKTALEPNKNADGQSSTKGYQESFWRITYQKYQQRRPWTWLWIYSPNLGAKLLQKPLKKPLRLEATRHSLQSRTSHPNAHWRPTKWYFPPRNQLIKKKGKSFKKHWRATHRSKQNQKRNSQLFSKQNIKKKSSKSQRIHAKFLN